MKLHAVTAAIICLPLLALRASGEEALSNELAKFQGTWKFASMEIDGRKMPEAVFQSSRITVKGDQFTSVDPLSTYTGTLVLNTETSPKQIDLVFKTGSQAGNTAKGVYEIEGDTFKLCISLTGKARPTAFAAEKGSGNVYEVLHRAADEKKDPLKKLDGAWAVVAFENNGEKVDLDSDEGRIFQDAKLIIKGDTYEISFGGQQIDNGKLKAVADSKPLALEIHSEGPNAGTVIHSIYKIEGDKMIACYGAPDGDRPKVFKTGDGEGFGQFMFTYKLEGAKKADKDLVQGKWVLVEHEVDGVKTEKAFLEGSSITIKGEGYVINFGGQELDGSYTLDDGKKPKQIDAETTGQGTFLGIYEVNDKTLKMCFGPPNGNDRPKEMKTEGGQMLFVFEREKK